MSGHAKHDAYFYRDMAIELAKEAGLSLLSAWAFRFRIKAAKIVTAKAPSDPYLSRRLWRRAVGHTSSGGQRVAGHVDSVVRGRDSNMPTPGISGQTGRRILVYHEADRAGPHVEAYIEVQTTSGNPVAYNVGVKRLSSEMVETLDLRKNGSGCLTEASQQKLIELWADEFKGKAWLGQSTDHMPAEARMGWCRRNASPEGYGSGTMRQVLADHRVSISTGDNTVEWRDPLIDKHRDVYVYRLMHVGPTRPRNILGLGVKKLATPPTTIDKLSLKLDNDIEKFHRLVGEDGTVTIKEDGASFYGVVGPKGARFWSHRISKRTGSNIEYTPKFRDWRGITNPEEVRLMGEFVPMIKSGRGWRRMSHSEISGMLNRDEPPPDNVRLEAVIYRVDRIGSKSYRQVPYEKQLPIIDSVAELSDNWRGPKRIPSVPDALRQAASNAEGMVGVPAGSTLIDCGRKLKIRGDTSDWEITSVDLHPGGKGDIAGVVWFLSLENGQNYKLGGGPLGPYKTRLDMMRHPDEWIGKVVKVHGFKGHEGRAAKVFGEHMDKGVG